MKRCIFFIVSFTVLFFSNHVFAAVEHEGTGRLNKNAKISIQTDRYAVLFPMALPFLFMIDAEKGIVGYPGFGIKAMPYSCGELILKKAPDFTEKVKDVGYPMAPNIETIIGLHPEFVVIPTFSKILETRMNKLHIPVIPFSGSFGDIQSLLESVKVLGRATNHVKEANRYTNYYDGILSKIRKGLRSVKNRPPVLYLSHEGPHGNRVTSGGRFDTLVNDIITKAGGISVSRNVPGIFGLISTEDILKWNPEYIIIGSGGSAKLIYNNKNLSLVRAVRNRKIFRVPFMGQEYSSWYAPAKSSLGLLWTAKLLHPETFKWIKTKKAAAYYYKTFWQLNISSLKLKGNSF